MTMRLLLPLLTLSAPLLATAASAGTFTPPEGCKVNLTVQSRGCLVSEFYTCESDAKGDQWRADFDDSGPFFLSRIDSEAQWLESYEGNPPVEETMDANPKDPASFQGLLDTGLDTFDFWLTKQTGEHTHITGFDKLTGKTATIDGVTLQQTEYEYRQTDDKGKVLRHAKGNEFISAGWRTFFSGHSEVEQDDGTWTPTDGAPVSFALPGKPGFDSTTPLFECDDTMSSLPGAEISIAPASFAPAK
jgi:hypothetical protein